MADTIIEDEHGQVERILENGEVVSEKVDRGKISDNTINSLETAIADINDQPTRDAIKEIVEILTGEVL